MVVWLPQLVMIIDKNNYGIILWYGIATSTSGMLNGMAFNKLVANQKKSIKRV